MKWPQKWLDTVNSTACQRMAGIPREWGPDIAIHILDALQSLGAIQHPESFSIDKSGEIHKVQPPSTFMVQEVDYGRSKLIVSRDLTGRTMVLEENAGFVSHVWTLEKLVRDEHDVRKRQALKDAEYELFDRLLNSVYDRYRRLDERVETLEMKKGKKK